MSQQQKMNRFKESVYRFWDTKIHFLHLHLLYFLFIILLSSALYYCEPGTNWNYIDALFMATTGCTDTGLNTIPMSEMSNYHMILLYMDSFLGCHVLISFFVVMVRRYYFSKRFEKELKYNQKRKEEYKRLKQEQQDQDRQRASSDSNTTVNSNNDGNHSITGPIRRRMSMLSIKSTPPQNTKKLHFFSRKRRGSFDTHEKIKQDIFVQHPMHLQNLNDDKSFSTIDMEVENMDSQSSSASTHDQIEGILAMDSSHPHDKTPIPSRRNSMESSQYHELSDAQQQNDVNNKVIQFSDVSTNNTSTNNTNTNNTNQQITFREDTNILRERERRKLQQNRVNDDDVPLHRTNSEYEIMSQPVAKSELTKDERYRIGGTEYRALEMLARIVPLYYIGFIMSFGFFFRIYIAGSTYAQEVLKTSNTNGPVDPWFFSFFMSLSAFTNLGLNHLDASMAPFQNAPAPLILSIILILAGNTAFAILLRFIIWLCYILTPKSAVMRRETFRYLLDHPRRCYTTLFPATQTWWLLIVLVAITLTELVCFLALNYWLPVLAGISWGSRFLDGLFQSVATRNGK